MKETDVKFVIDTEGGVIMVLQSDNYETEVNGEMVTRKFAVASPLQFENDFKVAPGTEITKEVEFEIVSNLKKTPFEIVLVSIYEDEKGEMVWELYEGPDAGKIFCNLLEITAENLENPAIS
jgi:hypothetical protein